MHSHERTLLASLGFSDPDKKLPLHDWACQYVAQPGILNKTMKRIFSNTQDEIILDGVRYEYHLTKGHSQYMTTIGFCDVVMRVALLNRTVRKAFPKCPVYSYQTFDSEIAKWKSDCENAKDGNHQCMTAKEFLIEVKINKCQIGDVIRQIKLYKEYFQPIHDSYSHVTFDLCENQYCSNPDCYGKKINSYARPILSAQSDTLKRLGTLLVTAYPLDEIDVLTLRNENITHVKLGTGFDEFVKNRQAAANEGKNGNAEI